MNTLLHKSRFFIVFFLFVVSGNIKAQCSITGSTVNANTLVCGTSPLTACNGVLNLGDGITPLTLVMNSDLDLTCLGAIQVNVNKATLD
ncbi:MAG TPA: hypothetical protein VFS71_16045, partial [Flavobacterium sp.]|uniref:hypothetical protein n=1 Tax=Flavobacterium sp. TaxID=239 RepID=UPI002DBE4D4D